MATRYNGCFVIETGAGRSVAVEVRERANGRAGFIAAHAPVAACVPGAPADFAAGYTHTVNPYEGDPGTALQSAVSAVGKQLPSGDYIQCVRPASLPSYSEALQRAAEAHTARERLARTLSDSAALLETAAATVTEARARTAEALAERDSARTEAAELREALAMLSLGSA